MRIINRRSFLAFVTALIPTAMLGSAQASTSKYGALLTKSSAIKVGQTLLYGAKDANGKQIEIALTRTAKGLTAIDGACTHQGCLINLQKNRLICPCHGSVFHRSTGKVILGPNGSSKDSIQPLGKYTVVEKAGNIYVR